MWTAGATSLQIYVQPLPACAGGGGEIHGGQSRDTGVHAQESSGQDGPAPSQPTPGAQVLGRSLSSVLRVCGVSLAQPSLCLRKLDSRHSPCLVDDLINRGFLSQSLFTIYLSSANVTAQDDEDSLDWRREIKDRNSLFGVLSALSGTLRIHPPSAHPGVHAARPLNTALPH